MLDLSPFADFASAAAAVLAHLHRQLGFDLLMVTRTDSANWIVFQTGDPGHGPPADEVFRRLESFCFRMARGQGPRIACQSAGVPAYQTAPPGVHFPIAAYVAVPLVRSDGTLFGTLCGIHPVPLPETILDELPTVETLARLLATIMETEGKILTEIARAERAELEALTDDLTGLWNRRAWDRLLAAEESRCGRTGGRACVISIDLDDLKQVNDREGHACGDDLLRTTAHILRAATRSQDVVARLGGDEFAVLAVECDTASAEGLLERLREQLAGASVAASLGLVHRNPAAGLHKAWEEADQAMYRSKRNRKKQWAVGSGQ